MENTKSPAVSKSSVENLLEIEDLKVRFETGDTTVHAANGITYNVRAGEVLAIVGESGSGKSVAALSVMQLLQTPPARISGGRILYHNRNLLESSEAEIRKIRGNEISMVFQDPMNSLNPVLKIGKQITEVIRAHRDLNAKQAEARAIELLSLVGVPNPRTRFHDYPHQFSGGQRQRIGIAMALACEPTVLIADEPTTALDVTIQAQILDLVNDLRKMTGMAVVWISHDLGVVANLADRVAVMYAGRVIESADVKELFAAPSHPYTIGLLESMPSVNVMDERLVPIPGSPPNMMREPAGCPFAPRCKHAIEKCWDVTPPLTAVGPGHDSACWRWEYVREQRLASLQLLPVNPDVVAPAMPRPDARPAVSKSLDDTFLTVKDLAVHYGTTSGGLFRGKAQPALKAVDGVSFTVRRGETFGLVGESGCGKSTVGRAILRLTEPTRGQVTFGETNMQALDSEALRRKRRDLQMIFQDPFGSLNPRHTIRRLLDEPLRIQDVGTPETRAERVRELMELVGLDAALANRRPHEISGGQRQRVGIGRALATEPAFLVADEPIAALDVSIQAQIVNLMQDLKVKLGLTYLFIAHDMSMVRHISDRIAVMYFGRLVEIADRNALFVNPLHPYTQALLSAVPVPEPGSDRKRIVLEGELPDPANPPKGCHFRPRCKFATEICAREWPPLRDLGDETQEHWVACHHAEQFNINPRVV